ncbi:precorrin-3B C(17)-methyltransferase [Leptolyngbya sp. CCY15150]|uniref:precorrin-3B C(17)-methyltransferase n=1 Tax=Leptolyngbya sp. CCY15150 TaxID=2767772 RepID=UPI0019508E6C|nr:precorrin-3B C(17)-methyltransferase [Leptolyngbya sp. CCY15150]
MVSNSIAVIAPTPAGDRLAQRLLDGLTDSVLWTKPRPDASPFAQTYEGPLSDLVATLWEQQDQLVFVLAVGAVVRLIAPFLTHKSQDPGIVVVDETGSLVLSLCGGHLGGADDLTRRIAALLGVSPVITSASAALDLPAVDTLGLPYGWRRGQGDWLAVAAAIAHQDPVAVTQTCGWDLWQTALPEGHPFQFVPSETAAAHLWISDRQPPPRSPQVCWHPRTLWVGVGCERGVSAALLESSIRQVLQAQGLAWEAIAGVASLDLKQDEQGLLELARQWDWAMQFFPADQLATQPVPNPSTVVADAVGTPSVAEAAAIAVGVTLIVEKQVFRDPSGACTVAIARAAQEYTPRPGKLYLIGTGPGALSQITPAAQAALADCDAIVGYQLYIDLIRPLLRPTQVIDARPITQEVQRAEAAIALARRGLTVAVVSSGDCGIYGMAGLVLECLVAQGWNGQTPAVEVCPGITALQALAARVGAPLMHDFCAISLSDLLTPWPVIEQRLTAAAQADFVVALYNPRSRTRLQGIQTAVDIFRQARPKDTPVAIARSLYRDGETIHLTTLEDMDVDQIDMLTVVLIGNQSTQRHGDRLVTPRGYGVRSSDT